MEAEILPILIGIDNNTRGVSEKIEKFYDETSAIRTQQAKTDTVVADHMHQEEQYQSYLRAKHKQIDEEIQEIKESLHAFEIWREKVPTRAVIAIAQVIAWAAGIVLAVYAALTYLFEVKK